MSKKVYVLAIIIFILQQVENNRFKMIVDGKEVGKYMYEMVDGKYIVDFAAAKKELDILTSAVNEIIEITVND